MKLKTFLPLLLGFGLMTGFVSCSDDDDDVNPSKVPQAVKTSFDNMFPNAKSIEWEKVAPWFVADFQENTFGKEAWYTASGQWAMTGTDYGTITTFLPVEVQNSFQQSIYSDWVVDDVDVYERVADTVCVIEVEAPGFDDITLFYDSDGTLLNTVQTDFPEITPNTVIGAL